MKRFRKLIKSRYDPVRIIFGNIYSKYKTNPIDYDKSQINSILFNYSIPNATQIIRAFYKEMIILCDSNEYIKYKYHYEVSIQKLKIIGYIYVKNFKPPPNYIALDKNNQNIMFNLLKYKQELIDRYNYYKIQQENNLKNENKKDYDDNYIIVRPLVYDSNDDKKSNNEKNSKSKPIEDIINNIKSKPKKNVQFSKDNFNLKSYISEGESKFESKGLSKIEPVENKDNEENKENSIESVQQLMNNFKNNNNNDIELKNIKKNKKYFKLSKNKFNKYGSKNLEEKMNKRRFSMEMLLNQKKFINLIKKNRNKFEKNNKYYLSVENFKEKLKENNRMKNSIEKYWKINKNFITNLIENKALIIKSNNILKSSLYNFNYTSEDSTIKNDVNTEYFNYISLCTKAKIAKINFNSKLPPLEKITNHNNIYSKKYIVNPNITIKKNNISNSLDNNDSKNDLMKIIQNNSDFMKNKMFKCVFSKPDKSNENSTTINNCKKKKIISFNHFNYNNNYKLKRKNILNFRNNFNYFNSSSHQNKKKVFNSV